MSGCTGTVSDANGDYNYQGTDTDGCMCYENVGKTKSIFRFNLTSGWVYDPDGGCNGGSRVGDDPDCDITTNFTARNNCMVAVLLPVKLTSFKAQPKNSTIFLAWTTATEKNNEGFEIHKSTDGKEWQTIGFIAGNGTTQEVQNYSYTDEAPINRTNYYRLKQVDFDGQFEYSMVESVDIAVEEGRLSTFPNPVTNQLNIVNGEGVATIYNVLGQPVKELIIDNG